MAQFINVPVKRLDWARVIESLSGVLEHSPTPLCSTQLTFCKRDQRNVVCYDLLVPRLRKWHLKRFLLRSSERIYSRNPHILLLWITDLVNLAFFPSGGFLAPLIIQNCCVPTLAWSHECRVWEVLLYLINIPSVVFAEG